MRFPKVFRTGTAFFAAVMCLVSIAGCGAGSRSGAQNATAVECNYDMPSASTSVNVLAYNSSAIDPFTNTMVKSCTREKVVIKHDPIDFGGQITKTQATFAGDTGSYDIVEMYSAVTSSFAAHGKIEPLDDLFAKYADKYKLNDLSESMRKELSYDGKLYALPMQAQMFVLAYRKDIFDSLGLKPPTTFSEMIEDAKVIQEKGDIAYPIALPWRATADISTHFQGAMNSLGKDFLDPSGKAQFNSAESKKALEEMKSLTPYMNPEVTTFDQPAVQQQMFNGNAAMAIMYSGRMNDLTLTSNTKLADDFAFAAAPALESGAPYLYSRLSTDGWSIPTNTKLDKDMLFQMMASSVSEEASKASVPAAYPAREGMVTATSSKYATAATETLSKTMTGTAQPVSPAVSAAIRPVLLQVITGKVNVEAGMQQMQALAEKAIANY